MNKQGKITVNGNQIKDVSVPVLFFRLKGQSSVFAECPALGIVTEGKNLSDAKKMFKEALDCWVEGVNEIGNISSVLRELGWKITKNSVIPTSTVRNTEPMRVLDSYSQNLSIPLMGA